MSCLQNHHLWQPCRSQMAEAITRELASDAIQCWSGGTEIKDHIDKGAVNIIKKFYGVDMEQLQYPKLLADIPEVDIVITMGCNVTCGKALTDVAAKCFDTEILKAEQTNRALRFISDTFDVKPEFLWKKYPGYAAFRRQDNEKWFAIIMADTIKLIICLMFTTISISITAASALPVWFLAVSVAVIFGSTAVYCIMLRKAR